MIIELLQQLIEFMRQNHLKLAPSPVDETETIQLRSWQLGVKGKVTREEIYDYLDEREDGTG